MITYNDMPVMGKYNSLHAITLTDRQPSEVIDHVRRWFAEVGEKLNIDIQTITHVADDRRVYTTIWYTEVT